MDKLHDVGASVLNHAVFLLLREGGLGLKSPRPLSGPLSYYRNPLYRRSN